MLVAALSFFSRISDSRFGGTYMTLLNTLNNLGGAWTHSVSIGLVDLLTFKECSNDLKNNNCSTLYLQNVSNRRTHFITNIYCDDILHCNLHSKYLIRILYDQKSANGKEDLNFI